MEEMNKNNEEMPKKAAGEATISLLKPGFLPVLPLKNVVALPKSIIPVIVGRKMSIKAINYALKYNKKEVFVTDFIKDLTLS